MESLRKFFNSSGGKATAGILVLFSAICIYLTVRSNLGPSEAAKMSSQRMFVCSETMKPFEHDLQMGESYPVQSPYSGKATGYPAEACYWTTDGQIKAEPTWVLLNLLIHKPGPTFCPDCGRLVVPHNPMPKPGDPAPPTQAQWLARQGHLDMR